MIGRPYRGGFLKTFLDGSVDRVIYRDYIVNRCFFIYRSLAFGRFTEIRCLVPLVLDSREMTRSVATNMADSKQW